MQISTPYMAISSLCLSRTSPTNQRNLLSSPKCRRMVSCFCSSLEKTTNFSGSIGRTLLTKAFPKLPVAPVTKIDFPFIVKILVIWRSPLDDYHSLIYYRFHKEVEGY